MADTTGWELEGIPEKFWPKIRVQHIVSLKLAAVAVKQIAAQLPAEQGRGLLAATDSVAAEWDGELCPEKWPFPWPFPGPRPHWSALAAAGELADLAATLPDESSLRADIATAASELTQQAARTMVG